jgi:hypothetical protein
MLTGFEDKGGGQVDGHGARARGGVGRGARMQRQGVESGIGITGHGFVSSQKKVAVRGEFVATSRLIVGYI